MAERLPLPLRPTWLRALVLVTLAVGLAVFAWWPMLVRYPKTQTWEGPFMQQMLEAARVSVMRYHELPLWNAYQCGGVPLWDNPQGMGVTPLVWPLLLLVDTTRSLELWFVLHSAAGFIGMWLFARHDLKLSREAAFIASGTWAFHGGHAIHFGGSGFQWASTLWLPLALFLWRGAERDRRMAVGFAVLISLEFWGAAVYPVVWTMVVLFAETLLRAWRPARLKNIVIGAAIAGVVGFFLMAGRLIPVVYQGMAHKRNLGPESDSLDFRTVLDMFLLKTHDHDFPGHYTWPEYGNYVGPILFTLCVIGVLSCGTRYLWLLVVFAWTGLFMLGHKWPWAPWHVLKEHVYPFKDMRVPSRFVVPFSMFVAAFAGVGVDAITRVVFKVTQRRDWADAARMLTLAVGVLGVGEMIGVGYQWLLDAYTGKPIDRYVAASPRLYYEGPKLAEFVDQPRQNRGRLDCWDEWAFYRGAPLWRGDVPQARGLGGVVVTDVSRTQNTFDANIDSVKGGRVLFNSSYDLAFRSNVGTVVENDRMLAVDVPPGKAHLHVKYWPRGLTVGLFLTAFGIFGVLAYFGWDWRRRRRPVWGACARHA